MKNSKAICSLVDEGLWEAGQKVMVRKHPYPYSAMLSICSDLDETPNKEAYFETVRYLNTSEETVMGVGVNLEVGNTLYFDMPENQFSYWGTDDDGRRKIRECIKSGHIDSIHSFGDFAHSRKHAERALKELSDYGCNIEVWIDHAIAPTNLGQDIMKGAGDIPNSAPYHADLSYEYGIRYIWRGRVTSIVGQNASRNLLNIWTASHPIASAKTLLKELAKVFLARFGNLKYGAHATNDLFRTVRLSNGQSVKEFMRCNPFWGGIEKSETAEGLADVLTPSMLSKLVKSKGFSIVYTHLGKVKDSKKLFSDKTKKSLEHLSSVSNKEKQLLVTTTRRMLGYVNMQKNARLTSSSIDGILILDVDYEDALEDLAGLTFFIDDFDSVVVKVNGNELSGLECNAPDSAGRVSVSIPWKPLNCPDLTAVDNC